jgi:hypothetical protein
VDFFSLSAVTELNFRIQSCLVNEMEPPGNPHDGLPGTAFAYPKVLIANRDDHLQFIG